MDKIIITKVVVQWTILPIYSRHPDQIQKFFWNI